MILFLYHKENIIYSLINHFYIHKDIKACIA